jgi:hypothetical protein
MWQLKWGWGVRGHVSHRRHRGAGAVGGTTRSSRGEHPVPLGASGMDSWRRPDQLLGSEPRRTRPLSRVIYGARVALVVGVSAMLISTTIGVLLGLAGGVLGRAHGLDDHDRHQRHADLPFVLLALAVIAAWDRADHRDHCSRRCRLAALCSSHRGGDALEPPTRVRGGGLRSRHESHGLIVRQIFPNLVSAIAVLSHGRWRASSSSSSGLGIQPPTPAWGNMRGEGRVYMLNALRLARSAHDVVKRPDHAVEASDRMPERHGPLGLRR